MNAVSANFDILGNEAMLGSAASVAAISRATGLKARLANARPDPGATMLAVLDQVELGAGGACYDLAAQLRERYPATPVVVLVLPEKDAAGRSTGLRAMELVQGIARAPDVVPHPRQLTTATKAPDAASVKSAKAAVPAKPAPETATPAGLGLTLRQLDVLGLIAQGKPNKLICRELQLAEGTVKCHVSAILRALNVGSRTQAALKAARIGLAPNVAA